MEDFQYLLLSFGHLKAKPFRHWWPMCLSCLCTVHKVIWLILGLMRVGHLASVFLMAAGQNDTFIVVHVRSLLLLSCYLILKKLYIFLCNHFSWWRLNFRCAYLVDLYKFKTIFIKKNNNNSAVYSLNFSRKNNTRSLIKPTIKWTIYNLGHISIFSIFTSPLQFSCQPSISNQIEWNHIKNLR